MQDLTPRMREMVAASTIRSKRDNAGNDNIQLANVRGRPTAVQAGAGKQGAQAPIPATTFSAMKTVCDLSQRQTEQLMQTVRREVGKGAVEPGAREVFRQQGRALQDLFEVRMLTFQTGNAQAPRVQKPCVVCTNIKHLIDFVCQKRGIGEHFVRFGLDGGGGFLKACVSILPSSSPAMPQQVTFPAKRRGPEAYSNSGIKKLIIVGLVNDLPELYENVKQLLDAIGLKSLSFFTMAMDMKLGNICLGLQSHASKHPCAWCEGSAPWSVPARPRTLGRLRECVSNFKAHGERKGDSSKYFNVIHEPLLDGADHEDVLTYYPPPELHLLLGGTNKLVAELNTRWGNDQAFQWLQKKGIHRADYRGGQFEGNQCRLILEKAKDLGLVLPSHLKGYANALDCLREVKNACFSHALAPDYAQKILDFKMAYCQLGLSVTPKMHALFQHVPEYCSRTQKGLAIVSEQTSEAVHHDFKRTWARFKVHEKHTEFPNKLLSAVVNYNSFHI